MFLFVEVAEEEKCDLIIMGSKKKKGILSRLFGDHVVEKVIDRAPCPVFVNQSWYSVRSWLRPIAQKNALLMAWPRSVELP